MSEPLTSKNWFGKASAGLILGFALALGISGILYRSIDVGDDIFSLPAQFTMWAMGPIWAGILSFCFLFRSGVRAWLWLGGATLAVWLALFAMGVSA
ncbi:hypothetical protein [Alteraurantiacibacter aquimixticola]|uniref:Uncharacterized protein n=1 Tax=Alteraurantiacibacter aquimixticola TaxID=2489173 RepID=A0A4T3F9G3_9SPHN|nr:hypothetical protein [Alteraurantiacibacter aquimixticola]TIX51660.1 hypothetical protein E5222_04205 [Alteraurantiacibacter aquimixticola]